MMKAFETDVRMLIYCLLNSSYFLPSTEEKYIQTMYSNYKNMLPLNFMIDIFSY